MTVRRSSQNHQGCLHSKNVGGGRKAPVDEAEKAATRGPDAKWRFSMLSNEVLGKGDATATKKMDGYASRLVC
jgi:hypothetical protein